ncbi:Rid family hydrolase [Opitutus terrae]|uniref:Endoribonuclease L-PSP n=1 Tax=Opitutus terrae (strain DSM 11246 / JCM 15787 / PB90-1) TaxID=452637 RepID=B1ZPQ0_OPITP|nr:Rid family hydrolase [Opitutus terrae]ACB75503.1 Endoribonuclease L-PSP [Opitutus terrae PB90-1]
MKSNTQEAFGACRVEVRTNEHESFTEYHLTATINGTMSVALAADQAFNDVAAVLAQKSIQPIQEKIYGYARVREQVLQRREAAYRAHGIDRSMPATWIQGTPLNGCEFVGLQIWGIVAHNGEACVTTVENPVTGRGRLWSGAGFRLLHLAGVRGTTPDGVLAAGHCAQAEAMFNNLGAGLAAHDFHYNQVVRTWIYVRRLLEWYSDLNRIRTSKYTSVGLGVSGGPAHPASTGIQCFSDDEECIVDALALDTDGRSMVATPIRKSPRQDSSFNYGSAFSRGMTLAIEGRKIVHISGTASINSAGASTHVGDAECQSLETLMSIAAILEEQGGSLKNITSATLFCKDRAAWEAWERVTRLLQIPALPKVCVIADVCRHDLLVEMEAVAVI